MLAVLRKSAKLEAAFGLAYEREQYTEAQALDRARSQAYDGVRRLQIEWGRRFTLQDAARAIETIAVGALGWKLSESILSTVASGAKLTRSERLWIDDVTGEYWAVASICASYAGLRYAKPSKPSEWQQLLHAGAKHAPTANLTWPTRREVRTSWGVVSLARNTFETVHELDTWIEAVFQRPEYAPPELGRGLFTQAIAYLSRSFDVKGLQDYTEELLVFVWEQRPGEKLTRDKRGNETSDTLRIVADIAAERGFPPTPPNLIALYAEMRG